MYVWFDCYLGGFDSSSSNRIGVAMLRLSIFFYSQSMGRGVWVCVASVVLFALFVAMLSSSCELRVTQEQTRGRGLAQLVEQR